MLVLGRDDVERLLDLDRLIDAVADAMVEVSAGTVSMPPRVAAAVDRPEGLLVAMPAYLPGAGALTTKLVSVFPANAQRGRPSHQAIIAMFDPETGTPVAVMDGEYMTAMRTAAGSALSARLLARPDASTLAIAGTGVEARSHGVMLPRAVTFSRGSRRRPGPREGGEARGRAVGGHRRSVRGRGVVRRRRRGRPTSSARPPTPRAGGPSRVAGAGDPRDVGRFQRRGSEIDDALVSGSLVVVESRATTLAPFPAGAVELSNAIRDGSLHAEDVVEIGELVAGVPAGRTAEDQITLYRSVGVAVQDAAAAALVLGGGPVQGAGTDVAL